MNIFKSSKKTLVSVLLVLAIIFSQLGLMLFYQFRPQNRVFAHTEVTSTNSDLKDPNFTKYSTNTSGRPFSPSYYLSAGGNEGGVSSGIISVDNDVFNDNSHNKFGLTTNPGTNGDDSTILMIKTRSNDSTRFGYKTSSTITLASNDYYLITVLCKTDVTGSNGASLYLSSSDIEQNNLNNFVNINTQGEWQTYSFYVQTNPYKSTAIDLEFWLGSKDGITSSGAVFFDDIHIYKLTNAEYQSVAQDSKYDFSNINNMPLYVRTVDLRTIYLADTQFENSNFEQGLVGWEQTEGAGLDATESLSGVVNIDSTSETLSNMGLEADETIPGNTNTYNNTKALFINNKKENTVTYQSTTAVTIRQHGYYRLSMLLKTGNITSGGAKLEITQVVGDDETPLSKAIESATSSSGLSQYNGYQEYAFYISGNSFKDEQIKLALTLDVKGYVIFDDISLQQINYNDFSSASSTYALKLNTVEDTENIQNGTFNFSANSDSSISYPLAAQSWTTSSEVSGIVNVNSTHWDNNSSNYGAGAINPGPVTGYPDSDQSANSTNNVLMLRNDNTAGYVEFKSSSFNINSNSSSSTNIVSIEVWVKTQSNLSNTNSGAYIKVVDDNGTVLSQISNIRTHELTPTNTWQKYTLYIKNGLSTVTAYLVLGLGDSNNPTSGYAYFDNVKYNSSVTDDVVAARNTDYSAYTDYINDSFNSYIRQANGINTPLTYVVDGTQDESTTAGVINLTDVDSNIVSITVPLREDADNEMLMIKNNAPTNFSYKSSLTRSLETGYYKLTAWVYVANLSGTATDEKYGASIVLSNVEDSFKYITTNSEDNNGWTQYSYYVKLDSATDVTMYLSLGDSDHPTQGYVFFDDIEIIDITQADYTAVNAKEVKNTIKTTAEVASTDDDSDSDSNTTKNNNSVNMWFLVPSIILALALLLAIVGYAMRKIKFRNPFRRKQKSSNYDRTNSLQGDIVRRELAQQRAKKIKEIDKQIADVNALIEENKNVYEDNLKETTSRTKQERLFTKYAKERTRLQKQLDNLNSAKAYITDENNIKAEEEREIRRRQSMLEDENKKIVKDPKLQEALSNNSKEEPEEKEDSQAVKKARARAKMNKQ